MVKYLYRKCHDAKWLEPTEEDLAFSDSATSNLGVLLKRNDGLYTADPMFLNADLVKAVERLSVPVAFTMSSDIVQTLLSSVTPFQTEITLDPRGFVLPIINSVRDITSGKSNITREAYICLCRAEKYVLVWSDSVQGVLAHGADVETRLLGLVCVSLHVVDLADGLGMGLPHRHPADWRQHEPRSRSQHGHHPWLDLSR